MSCKHKAEAAVSEILSSKRHQRSLLEMPRQEVLVETWSSTHYRLQPLGEKRREEVPEPFLIVY